MLIRIAVAVYKSILHSIRRWKAEVENLIRQTHGKSSGPRLLDDLVYFCFVPFMMDVAVVPFVDSHGVIRQLSFHSAFKVHLSGICICFKGSSTHMRARCTAHLDVIMHLHRS